MVAVTVTQEDSSSFFLNAGAGGDVWYCVAAGRHAGIPNYELRMLRASEIDRLVSDYDFSKMISFNDRGCLIIRTS